MHALVTGGGGFLGRYIVEQLLARGDRVRVFARGSYQQLIDLGAETIRGDVRDPQAVGNACSGIDCVMHTAATAGIGMRWRDFDEINHLGTQHVIDACRKQGVSRLVYTSSPSVTFDGRAQEGVDESAPYPKRWLCHYPHSKALAEQQVLAANGRVASVHSLVLPARFVTCQQFQLVSAATVLTQVDDEGVGSVEVGHRGTERRSDLVRWSEGSDADVADIPLERPEGHNRLRAPARRAAPPWRGRRRSDPDPQVKVVTEAEFVDNVRQAIEDIPGVVDIVPSALGAGARVVDEF